jgi:pimeloyl-ACP methyl ester carboxylesterase
MTIFPTILVLNGLLQYQPAIVVGHSQGGGAALRYAERMKREAKFNPLVITFDAAPNYRCPTRCINFMSRQYPPVPGASNINIDLPMIPLVTHTYMPSDASVRSQVRKLAAPYAKPME